MNDDVTTIVIDLGTDTIKAGFAGEDEPRAIFNIAKRGEVEDFEQIENNLRYTFSEVLKVSPEEHPILITEFPFTPKADRERLVQLLFETFNATAVYLTTRSALPVYTLGSTTGGVVVLDTESGAGYAYVVPVYDGYALTSAISKLWLETADDVKSDRVCEAIYNSIRKCDLDLHKDLYASIVLSGENTMMPDVADIVQNKIVALAPRTALVRVIALPERRHLVWASGSLMGSLAFFYYTCISKQEYDEAGPSIVHKKCF